MGVSLKRLHLQNFRNHTEFGLSLRSQQLILIGRNAIGKTNIIEALQLMTTLSSFRTSQWQEVVRFGQEQALIRTEFNQNERVLELELVIKEGKRNYLLNKKQKSKKDLLGLVPAVLFVPEDLNLAKGPAQQRRALFDGIGQQLSPVYHQIVSDYQRTLKQRNRLLKEQRESGVYSPVQESWDESLIKLGAQLLVHRLRLFNRLVPKTKAYYYDLSQGESLSCTYVIDAYKEEECTAEYPISFSREEVQSLYQKQLLLVSSEEKQRGRSLVGPHRDEIRFFIEGNDARAFASQGQQRTIALASKLAELDTVREISGNDPLLLLDDVMSELDRTRRSALLGKLKENTCTIITATDTDCLDSQTLEYTQVVDIDDSTQR